jgi:hypothetical protein
MRPFDKLRVTCSSEYKAGMGALELIKKTKKIVIYVI